MLQPKYNSPQLDAKHRKVNYRHNFHKSHSTIQCITSQNELITIDVLCNGLRYICPECQLKRSLTWDIIAGLTNTHRLRFVIEKSATKQLLPFFEGCLKINPI